METLNVKIENAEGMAVHELIVREGVALPQQPPRKVLLNGVISSPGDFAQMRKDTYDKLKSNVVANYTNRKITLTVNEADEYASIVTGTLELHPELNKLKINSEQWYDEKTLLKLLNFYGSWFKDRSAHTNLLTRLQQFKAKVTKEFTNADDYKGSAAIEKITKIEHDIPLQFELIIPVFTGGERKSFMVNICVAARDGGVSFWFESVELHELITKETETIFEQELARLIEYIIIKQW